MRKNLLIGAGALLLGMLIGVSAFAVMASPVSPTALLTRLQGGEVAQTGSGLAPIEQIDSGVNRADSTGGLLQESLATDGTLHKQEGESQSDQAQLEQAQPEQATADKAQLENRIIADYKQDLGFFFDAWQAKDMAEFRAKLEKAYVGGLFEKHARRAEPYLVQGIGLEVSEISFGQLVVESATNSTATIRADYSYTAQDYSLAQGMAVGERQEHSVQVRADLVKLDNRWLITGETIIH